MRHSCGSLRSFGFGMAPLLVAAVSSHALHAQSIQFDAAGLTVKLEPFYEFEGNFGAFCGANCGAFQGVPTVDTPLLPTDIARLPNGDFLLNTLGGTIKLLDGSGSLRGNFLTPDETGTTRVDPVRFGSTSLELHPDFGTPGAFGYGKAYHIVPQIPSEGSRRGIPESGVSADFSVPQKQAYNTSGEQGSAFAFQTTIREYDLSSWIDSGYQADALTGQNAPPTRDILRIDQPGENHATYDLAFNAAGDLFITSGDGGFKEGATHPDFAGRIRRQSSQNLNEVSGKVLRINPDVNAAHAGRVGDNGQYSIPADNPYFDNTQDPRYVLPFGVDPENDGDPDSTIANSTVFENNDGTLDEIWAVGLRSPIRVETDRRDPTGNTLVLGDVGGGSREESTLFTREPGGNAPNLGWGRFEGNITHNGSITLAPDSDVVSPQFHYDHSGSSLTRSGGLFSNFNPQVGGLAIEGGEVYVGQELGEDFVGKYIGAELGFHNFSTAKLSRLLLGDFDNPGALTALVIDPSGQRFDSPQLTAADFAPGFDFNQPGVDFFGDGTRLLPERIYGVYADDTGELFLLGGSTQGNATVSRIVASSIVQPLPADNNGDGLVDAIDYAIWRDNYRERDVPPFTQGDADGDGRVARVDFEIWLERYGSAAQGSGVGVPEPSSLAIAVLLLATLSGCDKGYRERGQA